MAYTITEPESPRAQAVFIRAHLRAVAAGMQPRRGLTKGDLLAKAARYTGQTYRRGEYGRAISDLTTFLRSFDLES